MTGMIIADSGNLLEDENSPELENFWVETSQQCTFGSGESEEKRNQDPNGMQILQLGN